MIILSTAYLGNLQYYSKILSGEAVIDTGENYLKQSYRNRCEILSANGIDSLIVPVLQPSGVKTPTKDIKIDNSKKWQHRHFQAIISAYRNSPYFFYYEDELAPCYTKHYDYLIDLNNDLLEITLKLLKTDIRPKFTDDSPAFAEKPYAPNDFRICISPKSRLQRPDPKFYPPQYYQVFSEKFDFFPNLSILDLLCCEGSAATTLLMQNR